MKHMTKEEKTPKPATGEKPNGIPTPAPRLDRLEEGYKPPDRSDPLLGG
jgi:hypothetical protein